MTTPTPEQLAQRREEAIHALSSDSTMRLSDTVNDTYVRGYLLAKAQMLGQPHPEPAVKEARRMALEQAIECCYSTAPFPDSKYHIADKIKELLNASAVYTNPAHHKITAETPKIYTVFDKDGDPAVSFLSLADCHQHINDSIMNDIPDAARCYIRAMYPEPHQPLQPITADDVTDEMLEVVEDEVSMGSAAWDCASPKEIIAAAVNAWIKCGSFAINEGSYDRMRGVDSNLCDPHYWMKKATELEAQLAAAWIPVSQRLPVEGESVFVFSKYGQSDLADFIGGAFENCWMIDDADETITHWIGKPPYPPIIGRASQ